MEMAYREDRVLLTEDKDFGWLAFVAHADNPGVVLIRFPAMARSALAGTITKVVDGFGDKLKGAFIVVRPGSVRISTAIPG
jgi:predicted nuclease of predicted toxin-antitoxin system